jgi:leader peptidase (prepilin peptidase)/N-methyltransferase
MGSLIGFLAVGLCGAALVVYLADVLPGEGPLNRVPCQRCNQPLPWARYLLFRRCEACGAGRKWRTFFLLAAIPAAFWLLSQFPPHQLEVPLASVLVLYLALVVTIDIEHRVILTITSVFGVLLGLGIGVHLHGVSSTLLGGAVGFCAMLILYLLGEVFVRYVSRRRGETVNEVALGFGDVILAGIAGLFLGWPGIAFGLILTVFAGGAFSLLIILSMLVRRSYRAFSAIAYGPFLALSIAVLLLRP